MDISGIVWFDLFYFFGFLVQKIWDVFYLEKFGFVFGLAPVFNFNLKS